MATWQAKCWLGQQNGYQTLEVQASSFAGAEQQLRRIYGAEQVMNLRQVDSTGSRGQGLISSASSDASASRDAMEAAAGLVAQVIALSARGLWKAGKFAVRQYKENQAKQP